MFVRWVDYRLFEYERELAIRELRGLGARITRRSDEGFWVTGVDPDIVVARTTYFSAVRTNGSELPTDQALVEAIHREGTERKRQATRFGLHGVHEYKGKFNPQLVRGLCNSVDPSARLLVDPFCGSGTAIIEAARLGLSGVGVDQSPVAVFMAEAKLRATLSSRPARVARDVSSLASELALHVKHAQERDEPADLSTHLGPESVAYLRHWFTSSAFAGVSVALAALLPARRRIVQRLSLLALSAILREVSLQVPEDLRIRRRPADFEAPPVSEALLESVERVALGLQEVASWSLQRVRAEIRLGSATDRSSFRNLPEDGRRLVVTSPPYATALPYIDTDRLSLVALGLATPAQVRALEHGLMGSREWTQGEMRIWTARAAENADELPGDVCDLVAKIAELNEDSSAGFRRKALAPLLYRYFAMTGRAIDNWRTFLRKGEFAVVIVGYNKTKAGGEDIVVETPELIATIAESRGFRLVELFPLETWPRYGLHHANGVQGEKAVVIQHA